MSDKPKISIVMPVWNSGKHLATTLDAIVAQTFKDWELIIMDGVSKKDNTLEVARSYAAKHPNIKVFSEPDEGPHDAILKALKKTDGEYVFMACSGDGYLDDHWFEKCMDVFDKDPEVSLVWGIPMDMSEDGKMIGPHFAYANFMSETTGNKRLVKEMLRRLTSPASFMRLIKRLNPTTVRSAAGMFQKRTAPVKRDWFWYWLDTGVQFPDGNMCVKKSIFEKFIVPHVPGAWEPGSWIDFYFNFNAEGYLSYCIPIPANFARMSEGRISDRIVTYADNNQKILFAKLEALRKKLKADPSQMVFRNRVGEIIKP